MFDALAGFHIDPSDLQKFIPGLSENHVNDIWTCITGVDGGLNGNVNSSSASKILLILFNDSSEWQS